MAELITLQTYADERGCLTVLEKVLPFEIKRVYWMYDVKEPRGRHRHLQTTQALICVHGRCDVRIKYKNIDETFTLEKPNQCLILQPEDWHVLQNWSDNAVALVVASREYDPKDYVQEPIV